MEIADAQREVRSRHLGGFYGQLVSGVLWLTAAGLGAWISPRASITTAAIGGFFIFPLSEWLLRLSGAGRPLSAGNSLHKLGMQVAFVLPLSMPLLIGVGFFRLNWFYPGLTLLLGAHYLPFAFLYGMPMFLAFGGLLASAGILTAMYFDRWFSLDAWFTGVVLIVFAVVGRALVRRDVVVRAA